MMVSEETEAEGQGIVADGIHGGAATVLATTTARRRPESPRFNQEVS